MKRTILFKDSITAIVLYAINNVPEEATWQEIESVASKVIAKKFNNKSNIIWKLS